jgi:hypothetical protein
MKIFQLLLLSMAAFVLSSQFLFGQEDAENTISSNEVKTLFSNKNGETTHGGYLGVVISYSTIEDRPALQIGGRIAWVINHQFAMGLAGNGFFNDLENGNCNYTADYYLAGGYGGLFFQPILFAKKPVHVSFPIIIGAGGVGIDQHYYYNNVHYGDNYYYNDYYYVSDMFFVFEPGIDVEFNMLSFMRMSIGASYRFTNDINMVYEYNDSGVEKTIIVDPKSLNNFTFRIAMLFGWF